MDKPLSSQELKQALEENPHWKSGPKGLERTYRFENFDEALECVNEIAVLTREQKHHPDFALGWGYVHVTLKTHSVNAVTQKDITLAKAIERLM